MCIALRLDLGQPLRADVGHAAHHAHRTALAVADQEAAVLHPGITVVVAAKAVFGRPVAGAAPHGRMDALQHLGAVFGVQAQGPRAAVGQHLMGWNAEQVLHAFVPPHGVGGEVPVPDGIGRGARHQMKALFTQAQRLVGLVLRGDVLERALHAHHAALRIAHGQACRANPEMPLTRQQRLGLQVKGRAIANALLQGLFKGRAVRWGVQRQDLRHRARSPGQTESVNNFLRPVQLPRWQFQ